MSTAAYPHIHKIDGEPAHLARMPRIRVAQIVMDYLTHAWSPDEMVRHYPHLLPAEVHAAMGYYYDHQQEIDGEIQAELDLLEKQYQTKPRSSVYLKLKAKGLVK